MRLNINIYYFDMSKILKNELLETIFESITSLVYVKDTDLKFIMVNAAYANFVGRKAEDIIGKTDFDLYAGKTAGICAECDMEVINKDCAKLNIEENISMPDGRSRWLSSNKKPYHDKMGKLCGIIGISNDISDLKMASIRVETIIDSFPFKAWLRDKEGRFLAVNDLLAKSVSKTKQEMTGKTDLELGIYPEEISKRFINDDFEIMRQKKAKFFEELAYSDNILKLHETYKAPVMDESGEVIGTTGYTRDISEIQRNLFESKKQISLFNSIIDNIPVMLFLKDAKELQFKIINKATEDLLGLSRKQMLGKTDYEIFPKKQADFFVKKDREVLKSKRNFIIEDEKITSKNNTIILSTKKIPILAENGEPLFVLGISENVTEKRELEKTIKKLAYFDEITNLPNRSLFKDRFSLAVERARRNKQKMMVVMLDFDKFKVINDKYGHDIGDKLLEVFGSRLRKIVRKIDTIARFGGDEFVMALGDFSNVSDMEKYAKKVVDVFKEPFKVNKLKLDLKGSVGISVFPDDSQNQSDLVKFADAAMYDAKKNGGNNYQFYLNLNKIN